MIRSIISNPHATSEAQGIHKANNIETQTKGPKVHYDVSALFKQPEVDLDAQEEPTKVDLSHLRQKPAPEEVSEDESADRAQEVSDFFGSFLTTKPQAKVASAQAPFLGDRKPGLRSIHQAR